MPSDITGTDILAPADAEPQRRFVVAGPQYPADIDWPANVERIEHAPPAAHRGFYGAQSFTLNVTRADMIRRGYSPSVRLFEAAACGTPIISDDWDGLDTLFRPDDEILIARDAPDVLEALQMAPARRQAIGNGARARVLAEHTGAHRAAELAGHVQALMRERAA